MPLAIDPTQIPSLVGIQVESSEIKHVPCGPAWWCLLEVTIVPKEGGARRFIECGLSKKARASRPNTGSIDRARYTQHHTAAWAASAA